MKRFIVVLVALASFGVSPRAAAQSPYTYHCPLPTYPTSCPRLSWLGPMIPPVLPVGTVCCNPGGIPWGLVCVAPQKGCLPPNTANETCVSCNQGKTAQGGQPIDLASGNTYISQQDIVIPGLGGGLRLTRTWNSIFPPLQNSYPTMFGTNWRSTYEERLILNSSDQLMKYARGDGSVWSFAVVNNSNPWIYGTVAPGNDTSTITQGSQSFTLLSKTGEKRLFDLTSGELLSIIDRNGNTTQLSYDAQNRLITVTDPALRHLNFNYTGASTLVSTVTSDAGITYSYTYDNQGRLTTVTKPDNTTITFVYDANSMITSVKDSQGKILESHTYDALGRGLTSSRANGVEGVTVTYPQ